MLLCSSWIGDFFSHHIIFFTPSKYSIVVGQSLSHVWLFVNPWTATHQASLSFAISWSWLRCMSVESMMPSNHLILCCPLLLLPSIVPSIRVFSIESALRTRQPKVLELQFQHQSFQWVSIMYIYFYNFKVNKGFLKKTFSVSWKEFDFKKLIKHFKYHVHK